MHCMYTRVYSIVVFVLTCVNCLYLMYMFTLGRSFEIWHSSATILINLHTNIEKYGYKATRVTKINETCTCVVQF